MQAMQPAFVFFVLTILNTPVLILLVRLPLLADLGQALKEKDPIGGTSDTTSYSRVTGLVGAAVITTLFWAIGNLVVYKSFVAPEQIGPLVEAASHLILVGSALFLPYAANQIKSAFGAAGAASASVTAGLASAAATKVAVPPPGPSLNVTIANLSSAIADADFANVVGAIGVQVNRDFRSAWGTGAALTAQRLALSGTSADIDAATDAIIYVGDASNDPTTGTAGAFGYHSTNFGDLPYAFVYLDVCAQYGETWSCTLSHEVLELLADPTAVTTVNGPAPDGVGVAGQLVSYDLEVCDPTQGDTYSVNNVVVSNFVTRSFFGMAGGPTSTNHLNLPLRPLGVRPGGYVQYEDSAGAHQINGSKVDAKRLAARAILRQFRRNARREDSFAHLV